MAPSRPLPGFPGAAGDGPDVAAVAVVADHLALAVQARKCWACGCFQDAVKDFAASPWAVALGPLLDREGLIEKPREYDCLGCTECFPAVAINALVDAAPELAESLRGCPTSLPAARPGWPPLPGDYRTLRYEAPVAVCTLNAPDLMEQIATSAAPGIGIVGTLRTENLGIERVIQNVLANPHLRFLILCGKDTEGTIGHLPGRSFLALAASGIDERGRIVGASGRRPVLRNVPRDLVDAFRQRVEVVDLIGQCEATPVLDLATACVARNPGPGEALIAGAAVPRISAQGPGTLVPDRAGYVVIHAVSATGQLVAEHYTNEGVLDCVVDGTTPAAVVGTLIERRLISRMDHAAYLGQELARAERAMKDGTRYVQDRAPGSAGANSCGCVGGCEGESE